MFICRACVRRASLASLGGPAVAAQGVEALLRAASASPRSVATVAVPPEDAIPLRGDPEGRTASSLNYATRKQLEFMSDPFKIAEHVHATLSKGRFEEALLLTRKASKDAKVTVSWNHLIEYQMKCLRLNAAIKLFNEVCGCLFDHPGAATGMANMAVVQMKKRGQLPNAQTYTVIFKGCAQSPHAKLGVAEATRIYYSMLNSDRIKPNTIHMNAVLQVCAKAGDIESLFNIVNTTNDTIRAPSNLTYTTILNALRANTVRPYTRPGDAGDVHPRLEETQSSIQRAKAVWEDAISRWRKGQITIDEELVCAMGRILLLGSFKDNDDVLSLIEQTMNIPRLDKPELASPAGQKSPDGTAAPAGPAATTANKSFKSVQLSHALFAHPGRNSLSLILTSLGATRKTSLAIRYWDLFTSKHGIEPDSENWYRMLRVLRTGHASEKTAELLQRMPPRLMEPKTFQLAMATCVSDNLNDHAFANAGKILDVMMKNLTPPDPQTLRQYLRVAMANHRKFRVQAEGGDVEGSKFAFGRQIMRAVDRLWEPLRLVRNSLSYPETPTSSPEEAWGQQYNERREVIALSRRITAALDKVITEGMASPEDLKMLKTRRNVLSRSITRFYEMREEMEPNLKPKNGRKSVQAKKAGDLRLLDKKAFRRELKESEDI
ncbi:uncharacterized protein E0L32_009562 [Thyridium curvatum]|uniref:Pentatricopeptide repeat protein n=1 Tax=Thyridium curvatum TaxID=1093900 RepID=A0A507AMQ7_9PEZI|nr:uncharacterized protein E0L32_009562 [Thyridium curvatum]TPX08983.1 hypothetical protein E0L32_009562 [Thyridium curvatum]